MILSELVLADTVSHPAKKMSTLHRGQQKLCSDCTSAHKKNLLYLLVYLNVALEAAQHI